MFRRHWRFPVVTPSQDRRHLPPKSIPRETRSLLIARVVVLIRRRKIMSRDRASDVAARPLALRLSNPRSTRGLFPGFASPSLPASSTGCCRYSGRSRPGRPWTGRRSARTGKVPTASWPRQGLRNRPERALVRGWSETRPDSSARPGPAIARDHALGGVSDSQRAWYIWRS